MEIKEKKIAEIFKRQRRNPYGIFQVYLD